MRPLTIRSIDDSDDEGPASLPRGLRQVIECAAAIGARTDARSLISDSEGSDDDVQVVPHPNEIIKCVRIVREWLTLQPRRLSNAP